MRVLSGIQPSGTLHIGNYFGMMRPMIDYQDRSELFVFLVNLHALTTLHDADVLKRNTLEAAAAFLALGLDPDKCVFWVQSDVPEVTELTWVLNNFTSMGLLERAHSYKDKVAKGLVPNAGLFDYPVLMAADILLYQSHIIPVGKDQKQHVEITRDIAGTFNNTYGETFVLPQPEINEDVAVVPGIDGQKMSKSYNNAIDIFTTKKELKDRIMRVVTDARKVEEPKDPDSCNLFALYRLFNSPEQIEEMRARYLAPGLKYSDVKKELLNNIWDFFGPNRDRRDELLQHPDTLRDILRTGAGKARAIAMETLEQVRDRVGLKY